MPLLYLPNCQHQGFSIVQNILALPCHLELEAQAVQQLLKAGRHTLQPQEALQSVPEILKALKNCGATNAYLDLILINLAKAFG